MSIVYRWLARQGKRKMRTEKHRENGLDESYAKKALGTTCYGAMQRWNIPTLVFQMRLPIKIVRSQLFRWNCNRMELGRENMFASQAKATVLCVLVCAFGGSVCFFFLSFHWTQLRSSFYHPISSLILSLPHISLLLYSRCCGAESSTPALGLQPRAYPFR